MYTAKKFLGPKFSIPDLRVKSFRRVIKCIHKKNFESQKFQFEQWELKRLKYLSNSSFRPRTRSWLYFCSGHNDKNNKNGKKYKNDNNPHINFMKGTVLEDKEQGVGIRDKG